MQLRLEVPWVAGGNLGSYRALGRVTGSCVSLMLYFHTAAWDEEQCAVQDLAVVQKEQSGKLCSDECYLFGVMLEWCQWLIGFDESYLLILKKANMRAFLYQWSVLGQCNWVLLAGLAFALCWSTAWAEFSQVDSCSQNKFKGRGFLLR